MGGWPLRVCGREFGINENWHFSIRSASRGSQALHAPEAVALLVASRSAKSRQSWHDNLTVWSVELWPEQKSGEIPESKLAEEL
jgi:hypothetical protein